MATTTMKPKKDAPERPKPDDKALTPAEAFAKLDATLHPKAPKA